MSVDLRDHETDSSNECEKESLLRLLTSPSDEEPLEDVEYEQSDEYGVKSDSSPRFGVFPDDRSAT